MTEPTTEIIDGGKTEGLLMLAVSSREKNCEQRSYIRKAIRV